MYQSSNVKIIWNFTSESMRNILALFVFLLVSGSISSVYAHTTVEVEQYSIEVGWGIEPPVVSYRNLIVFDISERGESAGVTSGIKNAFTNLDAVIKFGGTSKQLDVGSDPRPGHYFADIIPTKTGTYSVEITGELEGVAVSVDIPIEDVESTAILDFPPKSSSGSDDIGPLKQALSQLQRDVADLKENGVSSGTDSGAAYDFAIFGLSLGAAGVILAIVSMLKRK